MEKINTLTFPALTGVRCIAAFMVYVHHFNPFTIEFHEKSFYYFYDALHVGVTLFFVLSGFLIANRYYDTSFDFKYYLQKRFARIFPIYFILTTLTFIFGFFWANNSGGFLTYVANITLLKGFFNDLKFSGIPQGWTLTVEEFFYFSAPLFFVLIKKSKWWLFFLPLLLLGCGFFLVQLFKDLQFYGLMQNINFMLSYTFFGRATEFFVGIALASLINKRYFASFKRYTALGFLGIVLCIFILSQLEQLPNSVVLLYQKSIVISLALPIIGIAPFFFGLIHEKTWIARIFSSKPFILLGKSSYVFYLIHMGFIRTFLETVSDNYWIIFVTLNIIAIGLYLFIEKPLNQYFRNLGQ